MNETCSNPFGPPTTQASTAAITTWTSSMPQAAHTAPFQASHAGINGQGAQANIYQVDAVSVNPFGQFPPNSGNNNMTTIGAPVVKQQIQIIII